MAGEAKIEKTIEVKEFFEKIPPGVEVRVSGIPRKYSGPPPPLMYAPSRPTELPDIDLYCPTRPKCDGIRAFRPLKDFTLNPGESKDEFISYLCRNCRETLKTYAVSAVFSDGETDASLRKYGERPSFGPPLPSKLIELIRPEWEYFKRGRRSENQGLGIAAFAYYRRVIESQKNRILDEMIKAARKLNATQEAIKELGDAKEERQFKKAIEGVKACLPEMLLIGGVNPLTLVHNALSEGLHAETDEQCLQVATDIRIVMTELAERLSQVLKDEAELKSAVTRLLAKSTKNDADKR
jgi:hypothetical protein